MVENTRALLRQLPSLDALLQLPAAEDLLQTFGRPLLVEALRAAVERERQRLLAGSSDSVPAPELLLDAAERWLLDLLAPTLQPVVNATGIIIHTNLGRAPLSAAAIAALEGVAGGYSTLEYDLARGTRGSRSVHAEQLLTRITGAEAGLVVNNNAAAVLLMLTALCAGKEVIISRGQLVEIGGGFRVPDVMAQSGARLVEVGTTNRTHLADYAKAIGPDTAAILVAHHSNYKIIGFTSEPSLAELAELAHSRGVLLLYDQGSGALRDVGRYGLEPEPTVDEGLEAGVDLIAFSGDKLLGGPQAGILCGRGEQVERLKRHPLARAVRADKLCLAGLAATLGHYLKDEVETEIPVWAMMARSPEAIATEAEDLAAILREQGLAARVIDGESRVGGGSLPGTALPTKLVALTGSNADGLAARLRQASMPVIARIQDDAVVLDPRTILPHQREHVVAAVVDAAG